MGRQSDLYSGTPQQPFPIVSSATYNAAGQLTAMSTNAYTETRQYNANLQLIRLTAGGGQGIDFAYTYPTANNGRISQMTDNISGEQVSYTYDQLNRLVQSVSSVTGSMPFAYDGFGNLTQQGQTSLSVDPTTNRITSAGYQYNANGNVIQTPDLTTYSYDGANRLVSNNAIYNPRNQRVFDGTYLYLYTPEGKLAGKYAPAWGSTVSNAYIKGGQPNVYFAGKLIQEQGQWVMTDRLGSVRLHATNGRSSYQPYGAEVAPATGDQRTKFATYYRDSAGLDYAGQRYYGNAMGRFLTPDPGGTGTANLRNPLSWNRYVYALGDPVNFNDPRGRIACYAEDYDFDDGTGTGGGACADDGSEVPTGGSGTPDDPYTGFSVTGTGTPDPDPPAPDPPDPNPNPLPSPITAVPAPSPLPSPAPPTPSNPNCPQQYQNFFKLMLPIANSLATTWNTNANFILALSAYESGWDPVYSGPSHTTPINNPFGLTSGGGPDLTFPSLQAAANYWSGNDGRYIQGTQTIGAFANAIQPHYNSKNPAWKATLLKVYNSVLGRRKQCGD